MLVYDKMWDKMKEQGITTYTLIHQYHFSTSLVNRLRNNKGVTTHTLNRLCCILSCDIDELVSFRQTEDDEIYIRNIFPKKKPG